MVYVAELQLEMPDYFPAVPFTELRQAARETLTNPKGDAWGEFAGASNLIGWRFRACHEYMRGYVASWDELGPDVDHEEIYLREKALYGMYSAGVSCIESACYALYALASASSVLGVPFGDAERRHCRPHTLRSAVNSHASADELVRALDDVLADPEWREWTGLRHRMTHRSNLPRIIAGAGGSTSPPASEALQVAATSSTEATTKTTGDLAGMVSRLGDRLTSLLVGGRRMIPPSPAPNS